MNQSYSKAERAHVEKVKQLPCSVCDKPGPSAAHHIKQSDAFTVVALCESCHQSSQNGWHGRRAIWNVMKMDELSALNVTIKRLEKS
jgi:type II secretory ATPase GspE/PulE/Tfp pilus assembly ATPase PilB-like protein